MPTVALDQNLGSNDTFPPTTAGVKTLTVTTGAAAASGTWIALPMSYWAQTSSQRCTGITVGGSAATNRVQNINPNGQDIFEIWTFIASGGLASSSSIIASFGANTGSASVGAILLGAASFSGVTGVDTTGSNTTTGTGWSSGSASNSVADAVFVGGAGNETTVSTTSTAGTGTELHDRWNSGAQQGFATGYLIAASSASRSLTGTLTNSSTATTGGLLILSGTAPAGGSHSLAALGAGS